MIWIGVTGATYTWDYLNRMTQWEKTGEKTNDFLYNADGMRVRKTVHEIPSGETVTDFLLDGKEIAEEITGENVTSYVGRGLISKIAGQSRTIYHADGLGSTRAMSDDNTPVAAVIEAGIYDAYGNIAATYGNAPSFGYAGQYRYQADSTGLDYLKARYYDTVVGRFISRDPIGYKGGTNLYSYVGNRPTRAVDPRGLCPTYNFDDPGSWPPYIYATYPNYYYNCHEAFSDPEVQGCLRRLSRCMANDPIRSTIDRVRAGAVGIVICNDLGSDLGQYDWRPWPFRDQITLLQGFDCSTLLHEISHYQDGYWGTWDPSGSDARAYDNEYRYDINCCE